MSKLKNLAAIRKMIDGSHKSQTRKTFGFDAPSTQIDRKIGDVWTETDPKTGIIWRWTQRDGYKIKERDNLTDAAKDIKKYLKIFPNCPKETCTCTNPNRIDEIFKKKNGMCEDCTIVYETQLKITVKFNDYANKKMLTNAESFFEISDKEVEELKNSLKNPMQYVQNADGSIETWNLENPSYLIDQIDNQYNNYKKIIKEKLNG